MTIKVSNDGAVRVITFNHKSISNPFSKEMQLAVTDAALKVSSDDSVRAVVFTGGEGRFFSAGGDFNEANLLQGPDDVDRWIDTFMDMFLALLNIPKPTLAAISGYGIGIGLQAALMLDWRVMSHEAKISMPQLRHGIGGAVGGAILSTLYGVDSARETMLGAMEFDANGALKHRLVQEVVPHEQLMKETMLRAHERAAFPENSYKNTKAAIVHKLNQALRDSIMISKKVHRAAFEKKAMFSHFENIVGQGEVSD